MLIISNEQFLKEMDQRPSKSLTYLDRIPLTIDLPITTPAAIPTTNESSNEDNVVDVVVMENDTYDNFRKPNGIPNIPNEIKPIIGALALLDSHDAVSKEFGISKDTIGNLANDNHRNAEVAERKVNIVEKVKQNIVEKVSACVGFLEIAKSMPSKELLATAESLSRIHRNIAAPTGDHGNSGSAVQFIFYAPERQNRLDDYEVINAPN